VATISRAQAEDFLYMEAQLLDERRLEEWLELFTPDGLYWLPIDPDSHPEQKLSLIYDNDLRRRERVWRLMNTQAPSQTPRSRTQHMVGNVRLIEGSAERAVVRSAQIVAELRGGDYRQPGLGVQENFAADCTHTLVRQDGAWHIALKKMVLLNRNVAIENLSFLL
jgi:3-phenylpropionate/cinnamic acid dioxygenase small subunit